MAKPYMNPEPVPPPTQLAVLPFLSAVYGLFRGGSEVKGLRVTAHRAINRQGSEYLQQVCPYFQEGAIDWRSAGRSFPVDEGIIGAAYKNGHVWRTKYYDSAEAFQDDLRESMPAAGDTRPPEAVGASYLAVPFLGPEKQIVLILYADCKELNFFADDDRINRVVTMCRGFCELFDRLQKEPFAYLRNFPLQKGQPVEGSDRTVYKKIQESIDFVEAPRFSHVTSFNYEAAAA
jgi:hypothetical protein